jgi:hypothetical protein
MVSQAKTGRNFDPHYKIEPGGSKFFLRGLTEKEEPEVCFGLLTGLFASRRANVR